MSNVIFRRIGGRIVPIIKSAKKIVTGANIKQAERIAGKAIDRSAKMSVRHEFASRKWVRDGLESDLFTSLRHHQSAYKNLRKSEKFTAKAASYKKANKVSALTAGAAGLSAGALFSLKKRKK